ncbi:hypothetical protein [Candidatus Macondimonas diazotrophica]|uniref:Uncharacterized protein n=1 Tax=Candidatus Macondimonas diazotrophica TaxID=2305248 RepID=A0A4Z0F9M7_9GAMM|nr:hypothetical protein [Candidatus Macondimonas diazotrophica]TFZ82305.1 hypothetical protein E4680_08670 [Candidatus Macondimonas diazotrophica]
MARWRRRGGRSGVPPTLLSTSGATRWRDSITAGAGRNAHEAWQPAVLDRPDLGRITVFAVGCPSSGIPPEWAARDDTPGIARLADLSVHT